MSQETRIKQDPKQLRAPSPEQTAVTLRVVYTGGAKVEIPNIFRGDAFDIADELSYPPAADADPCLVVVAPPKDVNGRELQDYLWIQRAGIALIEVLH